MRILLLIFLFFGITMAGSAQKPVIAKKQLTLKIDSSKIEVRKIDSAAVKAYSKQKDFIYDEGTPRGKTWWDRFWDWIWDIIDKLFKNKIGGGIIKYVLIGLAIALIVFIVIKLIGLDFKVLIGKSKTIEVPFEESLENIHEIDFDEQIDKALQAANYRLAVRLLYLKTLKRLSDIGMINWLPEKTNHEYILEIQGNKQKEFSDLTHQFEYIWYGEFFIDKDVFEKINQSFHQFNQKTT